MPWKRKTTDMDKNINVYILYFLSTSKKYINMYDVRQNIYVCILCVYIYIYIRVLCAVCSVAIKITTTQLKLIPEGN